MRRDTQQVLGVLLLVLGSALGQEACFYAECDRCVAAGGDWTQTSTWTPAGEPTDTDHVCLPCGNYELSWELGPSASVQSLHVRDYCLPGQAQRLSVASTAGTHATLDLDYVPGNPPSVWGRTLVLELEQLDLTRDAGTSGFLDIYGDVSLTNVTLIREHEWRIKEGGQVRGSGSSVITQSTIEVETGGVFVLAAHTMLAGSSSLSSTGRVQHSAGGTLFLQGSAAMTEGEFVVGDVGSDGSSSMVIDDDVDPGSILALGTYRVRRDSAVGQLMLSKRVEVETGVLTLDEAELNDAELVVHAGAGIVLGATGSSSSATVSIVLTERTEPPLLLRGNSSPVSLSEIRAELPQRTSLFASTDYLVAACEDVSTTCELTAGTLAPLTGAAAGMIGCGAPSLTSTSASVSVTVPACTGLLGAGAGLAGVILVSAGAVLLVRRRRRREAPSLAKALEDRRGPADARRPSRNRRRLGVDDGSSTGAPASQDGKSSVSKSSGSKVAASTASSKRMGSVPRSGGTSGKGSRRAPGMQQNLYAAQVSALTAGLDDLPDPRMSAVLRDPVDLVSDPMPGHVDLATAVASAPNVAEAEQPSRLTLADVEENVVGRRFANDSDDDDDDNNNNHNNNNNGGMRPVSGISTISALSLATPSSAIEAAPAPPVVGAVVAPGTPGTSRRRAPNARKAGSEDRLGSRRRGSSLGRRGSDQRNRANKSPSKHRRASDQRRKRDGSEGGRSRDRSAGRREASGSQQGRGRSPSGRKRTGSTHGREPRSGTRSRSGSRTGSRKPSPRRL